MVPSKKVLNVKKSCALTSLLTDFFTGRVRRLWPQFRRLNHITCAVDLALHVRIFSITFLS